jgi:hypothetical protein
MPFFPAQGRPKRARRIVSTFVVKTKQLSSRPIQDSLPDRAVEAPAGQIAARPIWVHVKSIAKSQLIDKAETSSLCQLTILNRKAIISRPFQKTPAQWRD